MSGFDPMRPIPGPDPGACPNCGGLRKAGMTHDCEAHNAQVTQDAERIAASLVTVPPREGQPPRRYEVDLTARETFTVLIEADSASEARRIARHPDTTWLETWANGDRTVTGVKAVRRVA